MEQQYTVIILDILIHRTVLLLSLPNLIVCKNFNVFNMYNTAFYLIQWNEAMMAPSRMRALMSQLEIWQTGRCTYGINDVSIIVAM